MKRPGLFFLLTVVVFTSACTTQTIRVPAGTPCNAGSFTVVDGFIGARRGSCTVLAADHVRLTIRPEDDKVSNPSPWYAFKLAPSDSGADTARIELDYGSWQHRYWPKISNDGLTWRALPAWAVQESANGQRATITVDLDTEPVWLSAQELITPPIYDIWIRRAVGSRDARRALLGESLGGQPVALLDSDGDSQDIVLLVGRQHPPEVSGAFAFFTFWQTLFDDTELAAEFRARFRIIAVPLLNPDGVAAGNWRHNLGSTDLNRDWGPFVQPETQLIEKLLAELDSKDFRIRAFIDFHSTSRNLFYTQVDSDPTQPLNFSRDWLENARARIVDYDFTNEARPTSDTANGKNYMYKRYGIPSVTYEVGDETDRQATEAAAVIFAEEFMKLLLQHADE